MHGNQHTLLKSMLIRIELTKKTLPFITTQANINFKSIFPNWAIPPNRILPQNLIPKKLQSTPSPQSRSSHAPQQKGIRHMNKNCILDIEGPQAQSIYIAQICKKPVNIE